MQDNQNNNPYEENDNIESPCNQDIEQNAEPSPAEGEPAADSTADEVAGEQNTEPSPAEGEPAADSAADEATGEQNTTPTADEAEDEQNAEPSVDPDKAKHAFEWNYTTLAAEQDRKKKGRRVGLIFGLSMAGVFTLAVIALTVAIIFGIFNGTFNTFGQMVDFNTQINVSDNGTTIEDPNDATSTDLEAFKNSTVVVLCDNSTGTGIILGENGMIVTNHHVIENATSISVFLYDGRNYSATLIGSDAYNDIAVIKINVPEGAPALTPATFANSDNIYTGERVYAVGTPAGPEFAWSVSAGIVSHPNRELKFYNSENKLERSLFLIQTDALVNPGNSGGPLINKRCEVLGIVTMRLSEDYVGMGFAIPSNTALPIIKSIIEGYIPPASTPSTNPQIGIKCITVEKGERFIMSSLGFKDIVTDDYYNRNPDRCKYASHAGVYVLSVTEGFDAYGKVKEGDIIIAAGNIAIASMDDLLIAITDRRIGDKFTITVIRDGKQLSIDVTLGAPIQ